MLNKGLKRTISIALVLLLLVLSFTGCKKKSTGNEILDDAKGTIKYEQQIYTTLAENVKKEETVYVNLNPDGTVKKVNVTDWLHTDTPQTCIEDVSSLENITNVKSLAPADIREDRVYWDMDTTDLYYSGTSEKELPTTISIKYFLDDAEISASELAGKSGNLRMEISASSNLKKTVKISGKDYDIYCPMLLVGGMILPEEVFSNIDIKNGTAISDGSKQIAFFVDIPGADESLGLSKLKLSILDGIASDHYTITATVTNFEIGNIMFASLPLSSVGSIGSGSLPESVDDIKGILSDLESVQKALNGLDFNKIIGILYGDSNKFEELIGSVNTAVELYNENEKLIKTVSKYMTDDNLDKLEKLASDLNATDLDAIAATLNDPAVVALLQVLPQLSASLSEVSVLAKDLNDVMPMLQALSKDMDDPEIRASLENMPETLKKLKTVLKAIEDNKDVLEMINDLSSSDKQAQVNAVMKTINKYSGVEALSDADSELLASRIKEWLVFGSEYEIYTEKLPYMTSNVIFTYKTDAVRAPAEGATSNGSHAAEKTGFISRIKNLFK